MYNLSTTRQHYKDGFIIHFECGAVLKTPLVPQRPDGFINYSSIWINNVGAPAPTGDGCRGGDGGVVGEKF